MANRPWILPHDVRDYTTNPAVQARKHERLAVDIARAEQYVITYCGHDFSDPKAYPELPDPVRTATLLIAELYAANAEAEATGRSLLKSETNDDYSYTAQDIQTALDNLTVGPLLDPYVKKPVRCGVRLDAHIW